MKTIPLYTNLGTYCFIVFNRDDIEFALNNASMVSIIYTVGFSIDHSLCQRITKEEAMHILHPYKPIWLVSQQNMIAMCNNDFESISPITAEVIPTLNCCFRCNQCAYRLVKEQNDVWEKSNKNFDMTKEKMELVLTRLSQGGVKNIVFTGGGEPLVNLDVTLYGMSICNNIGLNFGLYTNGYRLTSSTIKQILSYNPEFIRISIYGTNEETFNNYTNSQGSNYLKIIANIKDLLHVISNSKSNTAISLSFLMHPILYVQASDISRIVELFSVEELKQFTSIRFTPAVNYDSPVQHASKFFDGIVKEILKLKQEYGLSNIYIYSHRLRDLYTPKEYNKCRGNGFYAEVGPKGEMYLCCEKVGHPDYVIGDLTASSLSDIWVSQKRLEILRSIDCSLCPSLCKPHEANKQMEFLCNNRINDNDLENWFKEINQIASNEAFAPGYPNSFES